MSDPEQDPYSDDINGFDAAAGDIYEPVDDDENEQVRIYEELFEISYRMRQSDCSDEERIQLNDEARSLIKRLHLSKDEAVTWTAY